MRHLLSLSLLLTLVGSSVADDWSVKRSPLDPRVIARYKAMLSHRPSDGYALGKLVALYRKHRSPGALVAEYRALAQSNPKSFAYQIILGHLQRSAGNTEQAIQHYERAATLNPKSLTVPAALAAMYRKLGRTQDAQKSYEQALAMAQSTRDRKRYLKALATLSLATNDMGAARRYFDRLVALEPNSILLRIELAQALAKSGHDAEAIVQYQTILTSTSDSSQKADVLKEIGGLLHKQGKVEQAVATYRKAMGLTAAGHWLRRELTERVISIYRQREDLKSLIEHYERTWKRRGQFEHEVLGRLYDETGDEAQALKSYNAALKAAPHAVDTRVRLIGLLERSSQDKEVISEYRKLASIAPGEPRYQLELAKRLYRGGAQKEAFLILDRCGQRFPGDASVHSALADLYARWGEQKRAMRAAQILVRIEPQDPSHLINLGEQLYLQGNKRKAIETWRRLLQVVPNRHVALARLAEIYGQHDMTGEAIDLLTRALKLKPKHVPYHRALALLLERKRHVSKALQSWDQVLQLAKVEGLRAASREARTHIIDILHRSYQLRGRINVYRMDFEGPARNVDAGFMLAEAYLKLGDVEHAAEVYRSVLKIDDKNLEALTALETVYRRQRKLQQAVELLKQLVLLQPQMARDYYQRMADLLLQLYDDKQALVYAHKALAMGSSDAKSYQQLAELYEKQEDYGNAMKAYRQAIKLAPSRFQVHFALARLLSQQGQYARAEKLYRQVVTTAQPPELIHKAFRIGVDLSGYLNQLGQLEQEILPLSVMSTNAEVYRRLLVQIYRRRVPVLIDRARQGNSTTRQVALDELKRIGIRGLAPLLEELSSATTGRGELVRMLGYLQNPNAVVPLLRIASKEPEESVVTIRGTAGYYPYQYSSLNNNKLLRAVNLRVEATVAVGRIADERAVAGLVQLLSSREGPLRDAAAWALSRIDSRAATKALFAALGDPRATAQMMACAGLGLNGGPTMRPVLEEVMLDRSRDERVRASCACSLGATAQGRATSGLSTMLESGDMELQRCAAWSLGAMGQMQALPALVRALWSKQRDVRRVVLWSIAQIAVSSGALPSAPIPAVRQTPDVVMKDGTVDSHRFLSALTASVADLEGAHLARALYRVVTGQQEALVHGLIAALGRHRDVALRVLADLDGDPHQLSLGPLTAHRGLLTAEERVQLDRSVHAVCRPLAPHLARLIGHRDPLVRERAISLYAKLAPQDVARQLRRGLTDQTPSVRVTALLGVRLALQRGSFSLTEVTSILGTSLEHQQFQERETAAVVAGQIGRPELAPLLIRALADPNGFVREAAVRALSHVGTKPGITALQRALEDDIPHVRAAACWSLGQLRVTTARAQVQARTTDPSRMVQMAARLALRRL